MLWVEFPLKVILFLPNIFETLDVNYEKKCQICIENENLE